MNRILLAYCRDNAQLAASIDQKLSRIGIPFEHITDQDGTEPGHMANYLNNTPEPVLLLVTDNFLKSAGCMSGLLPAIQAMARDRRVVAVVADGTRSDDGGASFVAVPTHFDRMVYALQYMNHWQSAWLELSDRHSHAEGAAKDAMLDELNVTRNVANEMGDLISALRESGYVDYPDFAANDFGAFFQRFGLQHWHEQYKHLVSQEAEPLPAHTPPAEVDLPAPEAGALDLPGGLAAQNGHEVPPAPHESFEEISHPETISVPLDKIDALLADLEQGPQAAEVAVAEIPHVAESAPSPEVLLETTNEPTPTIAVAETPDAAVVEQHINDAWFWLENGHIERGFDLLAAAMDQYPDDPRLLEAMESARAQHQKTTVLAASPSLPVVEVSPTVMPQLLNSEARSYELMGDMAMQKGDFLFAKYCWDRTVELEPVYPGIYRKLGMMVTENLPEYRETGMQYLKRALSQNPGDAAVHFALARLARKNNEPEAAEVYYRSAVATDPSLKTLDHDLLFLPEYALQTPEKLPETPVDAPINEATEDPVAEIPAALPTEEAVMEPSLETSTEMPADTVQDAEFSNTMGTASATVEAPELPEATELPETSGNAIETSVPEDAMHFEGALLDQPVLDSGAAASDERLETPMTEAEGHLAPGSVQTAVVEPTATAAMPAAVVAPETAREVLTVLITGATSGIGRATAEIFARNGHRLILTGRRVDRLSDLKKHFELETQTDVLMLPFDVRDNGAVRAALDNLPEAWQTVDVLINNAGLAKGLSPIQEGELDHWETMIDTNIKGMLYVTRVIAPGMVRRRRGQIVNIGSIAGKEIYPNGNVYCASKAAVDALTRAMRLDLHAHNIRVGQVSPGHVEETEFALNRFDGDAARGAKVYEGFQPLKASDVAEAIYFMVTRPAYVNIQDMVMYGTQQASATVVDRSGRD